MDSQLNSSADCSWSPLIAESSLTFLKAIGSGNRSMVVVDTVDCVDDLIWSLSAIIFAVSDAFFGDEDDDDDDGGGDDDVCSCPLIDDAMMVMMMKMAIDLMSMSNAGI